MSRVTLREARPRDVVKFSRYVCPTRFVGVVAVEDGVDIGIAIIVWGVPRKAYLTMEWSDQLLKHPFLMHRVAKSLVKAAREVGVDLYALEDIDSPRSGRWLSLLGFMDTGDMWHGERVMRLAG